MASLQSEGQGEGRAGLGALCQSPVAAATEHHKLGAYHNRNPVLEASGAKSRCWSGHVLSRKAPQGDASGLFLLVVVVVADLGFPWHVDATRQTSASTAFAL